MIGYKVTWLEDGDEKRRSRKLTTEDEARGFIKGLRICGAYQKIVLWRLEGDESRTRMPVNFGSDSVEEEQLSDLLAKQ